MECASPGSQLALQITICRSLTALGPLPSDRIINICSEWDPAQVGRVMRKLLRSGHLGCDRSRGHRAYHWIGGSSDPKCTGQPFSDFLRELAYHLGTVSPDSTWVNYAGKRTKVADLDRQHLSNIWWYFVLHHGIALEWVFVRLTAAGWTLLPYSPDAGFSSEILALRPMLRRDDSWTDPSSDRFEILLRGIEVGSMNTPRGIIQLETA